MHKKLINFVKYNNAFPIIVAICLLSTGVTFAASPSARDAVYGSSEEVVSVDNGLIVSADLDNFNFNLKVNTLTEDANNYYANYSYSTLIVEDDIWQERVIEKTLKVSKEALSDKDLGLYVTKELGDNINYELSYLKRVQKMEREKGESQKVVVVTYSGLIGKLLNPKAMVIEGYDPVIPEVTPEPSGTADSAPEDPRVIPDTPNTEVPVDNGPIITIPDVPIDSGDSGTTTPETVPPAGTSTPDTIAEPTPTPEITIPEPIPSVPATEPVSAQE